MNADYPHVRRESLPCGSLTRFLLPLILLLAVSGVACRNARLMSDSAALNSAEQIIHLAADDAESGRPVRLHGVVTYSFPDHNTLIVQDKTAGIFIDTSNAPGPLSAGQEVDVE